MAGQWFGRLIGEHEGLVILDLDDEGDFSVGHISLFANDSAGLLVGIKLDMNASEQAVELSEINLLHPTISRIMTRNEALEAEPDTIFPTKIRVNVKRIHSALRVSWSTDIGTEGHARLTRVDGARRSPLKPLPDIADWKSFRDYAFAQSPRTQVFRGQDCSKRLRTSFHRSRRKDLTRYLWEDVPQTHHTLSAQTKHIFDLQNSIENGAFLNLLQHHGYPTPLLDWSYSPFVAAFFAYRSNRTRLAGDDKVRIFSFNKVAWIKAFPQLQALAYCRPHLSILEALTIENQRAMPQQALSTLTNIDDIESYIRLQERMSGEHFLDVIDLPVAERKEVLEDLSLMGITAGTLFPGLDGACEELRGRYFDPIG